MKSYIWLGILLILVFFVFLSVKVSSLNPPLELKSIHPLDNIKGNASSSVIIMEYGDFSCLNCRAYYFTMKQLMAEFDDKAVFVFRYFPSSDGTGNNSELAIRATQAAGKQGKFWEMHNLLFEKQKEWSETEDAESLFEDYVILLGISVEKFKEDIESKEVKKIVKAQKSHATKLKIKNPPIFFINGEKIENTKTIDDFRLKIKEFIEQSQ